MRINGKALTFATVVALALMVGISAAATSAGHWSGKLKGPRSAGAITFTVAASGDKLIVSNFGSSASFRAPCAGVRAEPLGGIPNATVRGRKFSAVEKLDNGFGVETWKLAGRFTGAHAASGTLTAVLFAAVKKPCHFKVKWTAGVEAAVAPHAGATYTGRMGNGEPVTLTVSGDGKTLTTIIWHQPLVGDCPGAAADNPTITAHNVPLSGSTFAYTLHTGKITNGTGTAGTDSISGQFLAGDKASGEISTASDISSIGNVCDGNDTWTAHS